MRSREQNEQSILASWRANASPWITAIREGQIASRTQVTNRAVLETLLGLSPRNVLDIGCGEGWLTDALEAHGIPTTGVDAIPALLDFARQHRKGRYLQLAYEQLNQLAPDNRFDLAVCNFSLIGKESTEAVFSAARLLLHPGGYLVVQTLHPVEACGDQPYEDGWRAGSWDGFSPDFNQPAPWYFRTLASWLALFEAKGFAEPVIREPINPTSSKPASAILIARIE